MQPHQRTNNCNISTESGIGYKLKQCICCTFIIYNKLNNSGTKACLYFILEVGIELPLWMYNINNNATLLKCHFQNGLKAFYNFHISTKTTVSYEVYWNTHAFTIPQTIISNTWWWPPKKTKHPPPKRKPPNPPSLKNNNYSLYGTQETKNLPLQKLTQL